ATSWPASAPARRARRRRTCSTSGVRISTGYRWREAWASRPRARRQRTSSTASSRRRWPAADPASSRRCSEKETIMSTDIMREEAVTTRVGDKLKGRVAFVTGGTRGIGAAICRSLASQGATLAAGYAGNDTAAEKFRGEFASVYRTPVSIHKGNV